MPAPSVPSHSNDLNGFQKPITFAWEEWIASVALAVVFAAVVWGVMARYVSETPATWSNEVATLGFAWIVFLGAAGAARRGLHAGVDLLTSLLPDGLERLVSLVVSFFLALALAYIAYLAIQIGIKSINRPTPVLRLPVTITYAAATIGFASMALSALMNALIALRALRALR